MNRWIEVINTERDNNLALVLFYQEKPLWTMKVDVKLNWVESIMKCKFEDGEHPNVRVKIENLEFLN